MISRTKRITCVLLAIVVALPLFLTVPTSSSQSVSEVAAAVAYDITVDLSDEKQVIRGFGGMNHSVWIGDLTPEQREIAFGNEENQLGFSVLRIPIHENKDNWIREVDTAKAAIEHGAIVFASPWNPPNEMVENFTFGMTSGTGSNYEAEKNTELTNAVASSDYSGYTGTGYVEFQKASDAAIQWNNIIIGSNGTKNIKFIYAQESGTSYLDIYLNGKKVIENSAFEATGSWSTWKEKSIQIPMTVGNNNVLKIVTTGTGGPNIDYINATAYVEIKNGKRLKHDMYDEYANYLNEFDSFMKSNGVELYAISIQNEPDYAHDWTWWNTDEIVRFMKENAGSINTRVIAPESFSYVKGMSDPILNDPEALVNMDILGAHTYGTSYNDFSYPLFEEKGAGKELWMTEVYYPNSDTNSADRWPEALGVAEHMYNAMVEGDFQTYVWWYIRRHYGPLKDDNTISKRGASMAHYSKFVRPGYVRVEATKNPDPNVYISAYKGDNKVVIVAVNKGDSVINENIFVDKGLASTVSSWVTDGSRSLEAGLPIKASDGSFTAELLAQSVTTFVAEISNDIEAPVTSYVIEGEGENDWYRSPVEVSLTAEDEGTGVSSTFFKLNDSVASIGNHVRITNEGVHSISYWSVDKAGNKEKEKTITISIDLTLPVISFSVQDGTIYGIDQNITIGCKASDARSGIASTDCSDITIEAYKLGVGDHTFSAFAEDRAGNTISQSITISVQVDFDSLSGLVTQFVKKEGIQHALINKLNQAKESALKGNQNAMLGQLNAFVNQVNAQSGKAFTEEQAQLLTNFANALK